MKTLPRSPMDVLQISLFMSLQNCKRLHKYFIKQLTISVVQCIVTLLHFLCSHLVWHPRAVCKLVPISDGDDHRWLKEEGVTALSGK